jgi:hypothetical protein
MPWYAWLLLVWMLIASVENIVFAWPAKRALLTRIERLEDWREERSGIVAAIKEGTIELPGGIVVTESEYDDMVESGEYVPESELFPRKAREVNSKGVPIGRKNATGNRDSVGGETEATAPGNETAADS